MAFEFNFDNLKTDLLSDSRYINENKIIKGKVNSIKNDPTLRIRFRQPFKNLSPYRFTGFDLMYLDSFEPTWEELDSYDSPQASSEQTYMSARDQNLIDQFYNALFVIKYPGITPSIPTPLSSPTIYFKDVVFNVNVTTSKQMTQYDEWYRRPNSPSYPFIGTPADLMPGVTQINVLPPVRTAKGLPKKGKAGDIIIVNANINNVDFSGGDGDYWHAWDVIENKFTRQFFDKYFSRVLNDMFADTTSIIEVKRKAILSLSPFLWSANYIPSYRIKRDILPPA
jgi:hypothetical protein